VQTKELLHLNKPEMMDKGNHFMSLKIFFLSHSELKNTESKRFSLKFS